MARFSFRVLLAAVVVMLAMSALVVPSTFAQPAGGGATIVVSTTDDVVADDGLCSLREAITSTNNDAAPFPSAGECIAGMGPDTVVLTTGIYAIAIADPDGADENDNASGDFDLDDQLSILGTDAANTQISGAQLDRVIHVLRGSVAEIKGVRIFDGRTEDGEDRPNRDDWEAGEGGAGILNEGYLFLSGVVVEDNVAGNGSNATGTYYNPDYICSNQGSGGGGAGICNLRGTLVMVNSRVSNNKTGRGGAGYNGTVGAAAGYGAGIYTIHGNLYMYRSEVSHNTTAMGGPGGGIGGEGGGVFVGHGTAYMFQSDVSYNRTGDGGDGGPGGTAGGIFDAATEGNEHMEIVQTAIHHNTTGSGSRGGDGAGIYSSGHLSILDSVIASNQAGTGTTQYGGRGGGVAIANGTNILIKGTAIVDNRAGNNSVGKAGDGGGIFAYGTANIVASTIAQNQAGQGPSHGYGGGIASVNFSEFPSLDPTMLGVINAQDSTIVDNTAQIGGGLAAPGTSQMMFRNTIIANNNAPTGPDCSGTLNSGGYILVENTSGCNVVGSTTGVKTGVDPLLGAMVDSEAVPPYYPLLANSPALDAGSCPDQHNDQRNSPRPIDMPTTTNVADGCDMGAVEAQLVAVAPHYLNASEAGATDVYSITLSYTPTAPVTITLSADEQITVTPEFVVITPTMWTLPHTITVSAVDDSEAEGMHPGIITHAAVSSDTVFNGVAIADVTVTIIDNESEIPPVPTPVPTALELGTVTSTSGGDISPFTAIVAFGIVLSGAVILFKRRR